MTADQRFTLIIAGLSLIFAVMVAILGMIIKVVREFTRMEDKLANHIVDADRTRIVIFDTLKEDRKATDSRLRWLETNLWSQRARGH